MANKDKKTEPEKKPVALSKSELVSIVDGVRQTLDVMAREEADKASKLAKAHPGEETSTEVPPDDSATSGGPEASSAPADDTSSAPPSDDSGAPPADASAGPPADASAAPPTGDGDGDADDQGGAGSVEALEQAYAQLPLHELQMHYLACKAALVQAMGPQAGADDGTGAPPADASAGAPPAPPAPSADAGGPPPAMKSESGTEMPSDEKANGENPLHVKKSEKNTEVEALRKRLDDQEQAFGTVVSAMREALERPMRKSIVSTDVLPASTPAKPAVENLSKSEIDKLLKTIVRKPTLEKSERATVNRYYAEGQIQIDGIKPLIEKYA